MCTNNVSGVTGELYRKGGETKEELYVQCYFFTVPKNVWYLIKNLIGNGLASRGT